MGLIDNVDFFELEAEKYWSFPKSYKGDPKADVRNFILSGNYIGSRKMDGAYYRFVKDMEGNMSLQGRSRSVVTKQFLNKIEWVPHLHEFFESLPNGTCLLGELYFPNNEGSNHVTTIMGCTLDKAIARQEKGDKLCYYIFDIWAYDGVSFLKKPITERVPTKYIEGIDTSPYYITPSSYVQVAKYFSGQELWNRLDDILNENGEGIVITKRESVPTPGKRPARKTIKVKKELSNTIDCFFTGGVTPPTKIYTGKEITTWQYWYNPITEEKLIGSYYKEYKEKNILEPITKNYYYNMAGSLQIGVLKDNKVVAIGLLSNLTEEIKSKPQEYKGRPIEVTAMQFTDDGALRHAKMLRFRDDLTIYDCTWEKIEGIEK